MKRLLLLIMVTAMLLTIQVVPVFADNMAFPNTLSAEDEQRIMSYKIPEGPFAITNEKVKELVGNYRLYLEVAKDYAELHENYNYKDISTEAGKKKYLAGFDKYSPDTPAYLKSIENDKLSYILTNKLVKQATFLTNDNCIFVDGSGATTVMGVLYFKFVEMGKSLNGGFNNVKPGILYKMDVFLNLSGRPDYTDAVKFQITRFGYMSAPTVATSSTMLYTASIIKLKVLVDGKAKTLESYNISGSGNTYFKLSDIAMVLNRTKKQFGINYDNKKNTLNLTTGKAYTPVGNELNPPKREIVKFANKSTTKILVNGKKVKLDSYIIDGNNYFEITGFAKTLDFKAKWETIALIIDTSKGYNE